MGGWAVVIDTGCAVEDDETLLAFIIAGIKMQRYFWIVLNMFDLACFHLTEDQERIIFPDIPDGSRLRRAGGVNGG